MSEVAETAKILMDQALISTDGVRYELEGKEAGVRINSIRQSCYALRASMRVAMNGNTPYNCLRFRIVFPKDENKVILEILREAINE